MVNSNEPNSCFYFSLSKIKINNMGLLAFTAAYCGPAVLKYPLKHLLLPEVHFLLALDFTWGAQTYWRCWEWWHWSSVSSRVSWCDWCIWSECILDVFPGGISNQAEDFKVILAHSGGTIFPIYVRITPSVLMEALVWGLRAWNNCLWIQTLD